MDDPCTVELVLEPAVSSWRLSTFCLRPRSPGHLSTPYSTDRNHVLANPTAYTLPTRQPNVKKSKRHSSSVCSRFDRKRWGFSFDTCRHPHSTGRAFCAPHGPIQLLYNHDYATTDATSGPKSRCREGRTNTYVLSTSSNILFDGPGSCIRVRFIGSADRRPTRADLVAHGREQPVTSRDCKM